jgi:hypothetical protein
MGMATHPEEAANSPTSGARSLNMAITMSQLRHKIEMLNLVYGEKPEPWERSPGGGLRANVGTFLLEEGSDILVGLQLQRMHNACGAVDCPAGLERLTKQQAALVIDAMIYGYRNGRQAGHSRTDKQPH